MQAIIKLFLTIFTTVSVFTSGLLFPAEISPESKDFEFTALQYPDEAIVTLEEA